MTIVCAASLDGKLSTPARDPVRFTSRRDRERLHALRDAADAIVLGAATVRAEDPPLLTGGERSSRARAAAGRRPWPVRAVLSRTLELPAGRALAAREGSPVYVFAPEGARAARRASLEALGARVRELGPAVAPARVLEVLASEEGVRDVLLEGGGAANALFFSAGLVDALELTLCPVVIGGERSPTLVDGAVCDPWPRARLVHHEATPEGELFLSYRFDSGGSASP